MKIDGVVFADAFTDAALLFLKIDAAFVDIGNQRDCLREVDVDGFVLRYFLVKHIRVFNRAVFRTGRTPRAFVLDDVAGFFGQGYLEVPCLTLYGVNFGVRQYLYVRMPADLDQFR
jgi:hypothetical protein